MEDASLAGRTCCSTASLAVGTVSPVVNQQPSAAHALKTVLVGLTVHLTSTLAAVKVL